MRDITNNERFDIFNKIFIVWKVDWAIDIVCTRTLQKWKNCFLESVKTFGTSRVNKYFDYISFTNFQRLPCTNVFVTLFIANPFSEKPNLKLAKFPSKSLFQKTGRFLELFHFHSKMAETTSEKIYDLECIEQSKQNDALGREKFLDGVKHMEEILKGDQFCDLHVLELFCAKIISFWRVDCEIGVDGAKYLGTMLKSKPMKSLTELNLIGNYFLFRNDKQGMPWRMKVLVILLRLWSVAPSHPFDIWTLTVVPNSSIESKITN